MLNEERKQLSKMRLEHAQECLEAAKTLVCSGSYKSAANRLYYCVFHAMRAVLALDGIDMKHHSGVIAEFRKLYIKTGVFPEWMSDVISVLFEIRSESDYDDLCYISKETVDTQTTNASRFYSQIYAYLNQCKITIK